MSVARDKLDLLTSLGFRYSFEREIYYSKERRSVFSLEAVDDHDIDWLRRCLDEAPAVGWIFFFNDEPESDVKQAIIGELES